MHFSFTRSDGVIVRVQIAANVDIKKRLDEFGVGKKSTLPRDAQGRLYARATYLKYNSAVEEFSAVVSSLDEWGRGRSVKEEERGESLMLLEAFDDADPRVAGALLLRSAWTNDVVIDFLVVNQQVTETRSPRLDGVGGLLCYAALSIGLVSGAERVLVETASHTKKYWTRFCRDGCDLWRIEKTAVAVENLAAILRSGGWTPEFHPNDE